MSRPTNDSFLKPVHETHKLGIKLFSKRPENIRSCSTEHDRIKYNKEVLNGCWLEKV